jgi:hypothetical protein
MTTSNLWKGLNLSGEKEKQEKAKKILLFLGATEVRVQTGKKTVRGWKFPPNP